MKVPRYGAKIRKLVKNIEEKKKAEYVCPKCGKAKVKRKSFAIWVCKACGAVFTGGAYSATTAAGEVSRRFVEGEE
jgi:large subunit ribosomal protein L37Ae